MKLGTMVKIKSPEEALERFKILRECGFAACQLVYKPKEYDLSHAAIIRQAAEETGMDICSQFCGYYDGDTVWDNYFGYMTAGLGVEAYRKSRLDYVKSAAAFAHEVGITDIIIHAGFIPNNPFATDYPPILTAVRQLCVYCKRLGMNVLLETGGESSVALLRLIADTGCDNLFVNLDPANMLMYGYANPVDAMYTVGKYVRNIHGKDGMPPTDSRRLGEEKPVGRGRVDFEGLFRELKALGYDRYVIVEREIRDGNHANGIMEAKRYFESVLTRIGYFIEA